MAESLRVMTFNLWHGGDAGKQPLAQSVRVIEAARADIVGVQETLGLGFPEKENGALIAEKLGWHYLEQARGRGIASRFPIVSSTHSKAGAKLSLPSGRTITHFNVHLMYTPYQPYQLLKIPYNNAPFITTEAEAISEAKAARGEQVRQLIAEINEAAEGSSKGDPLFVTGDFNEPSHLDWTKASHAAGHCPVVVEWPSTKALADAGFQDAYRKINPNPVHKRGLTWTPTTVLTDPKDRHDRIDFVLFRGKGVTARAAQILGESKAYADSVVEPYPSDHRAVVCEFQLR